MLKPKKAKRGSNKKPIEQYAHKGKQRANNPPVGLVTPQTDKESGRKTYAYDPHLDPQLIWAGKAERTSLEVSMVSPTCTSGLSTASISVLSKGEGLFIANLP